MTEMIKRVALATCGMLPCICKHKMGFEGMPCLVRGRKAIEAMRDPTNAMTFAGAGKKLELLPVVPKIWRDMIDAILHVESEPLMSNDDAVEVSVKGAQG